LYRNTKLKSPSLVKIAHLSTKNQGIDKALDMYKDYAIDKNYLAKKIKRFITEYYFHKVSCCLLKEQGEKGNWCESNAAPATVSVEFYNIDH
jgi:hypothetical protein